MVNDNRKHNHRLACLGSQDASRYIDLLDYKRRIINMTLNHQWYWQILSSFSASISQTVCQFFHPTFSKILMLNIFSGFLIFIYLQRMCGTIKLVASWNVFVAHTIQGFQISGWYSLEIVYYETNLMKHYFEWPSPVNVCALHFAINLMFCHSSRYHNILWIWFLFITFIGPMTWPWASLIMDGLCRTLHFV